MCLQGTKSAPIQLAQCWFPGLAIYSAKILIYFFQIKYTEAILSNGTRKLLWFEITKMLIAVRENNFVNNFIIFGRLFSLCAVKKLLTDSSRRIV